MESLPPWAQSILNLIVGPVGALITLCVIIYFLWKLYREEQKENRANFATVKTLASAIEKQAAEIKAWREAFSAFVPRKRGKQ